MADLIQIRRDTAENWASVNPILGLGEIGFVTVSGSMTNPIQFKVGDGTLQWNNLPLQYGSGFESITLGETVYYPEDDSRSIVLPEIGGSSSVMPGSGENSAQQSGSGAEASGEGAFAEGDGVASGDYSHAEGAGTIALGVQSHAEGNFTQATGNYEHAEGTFNVTLSNSIHTVGVGTSLTSRKNGHVITTDGKHYIPGVGSYVGTEETLPANQDLATVLSNKLSKGTPTLGYNYLSCSLVSGHNYLVSRYSEDQPDLIFILSSDYISDVYAYSFTDPNTTLGLVEESGGFKLYIKCTVDASQQSYVSVIDLFTEEFVPLVNVVQLPQNVSTIVPKVIQDMYISGTVDTYGSFVPFPGSTPFAVAVAAFKAGRDIKLVYSDGTISRYYSIIGYYGDPDGEGDFLYAFSPILTAGGNLQIVRWYNPN